MYDDNHDYELEHPILNDIDPDDNLFNDVSLVTIYLNTIRWIDIMTHSEKYLRGLVV